MKYTVQLISGGTTCTKFNEDRLRHSRNTKVNTSTI
jgi:hypothetical protein